MPTGIYPRLSPEARFREKIKKTGSCWLWTGTISSSGYGILSVNNRLEGAHRISWKIYRGAIPSDLNVCHKCDNPCCVNPSHLFIGTQLDNMGDAVVKGRIRNGSHVYHGVVHHRTILTVRQVKNVLRSSKTNTELGKYLNVSRTTIYRIRAGKNWQRTLRKEFGNKIPKAKRQIQSLRRPGFCRFNHALTKENIYLDRNNYSVCKTCRRSWGIKIYHY
jgi:hypothetical protein